MTSNSIFHFEDESQAISSQSDLATKIVSVDDPGFNPRLICGIDVSYQGETAFVAATVWDAREKVSVERVVARSIAPRRYVPGFFGYREGPLLVEISRNLQSSPDVFLVDGHGVAHPRRFGMASQVGLAINHPTIGVAKSLLHGKQDNGTILAANGDIIGSTLSTANGKRLYVSVGHRISLRTALRVVQECILDGQPVPLRQAHFDSIRMRKGEDG
ncbi:endonuclease V [Candidatus Bathyarchaeota archaeon]|nr:endonuclease V [Candidatus Bathyarchaeota archaeon]